MTLGTEYLFPIDDDRLNSQNVQDLAAYTRELVYNLSDMYEDVSISTNGTIKEFTPTIVGSVTPGVGTYTLQSGLYLRKNLLVDYWFDITWTAHTGAGQLLLQLPYKVKKVISFPFNDAVFPSSITLGVGYTHLFASLISDTYTAAIIQAGSGLAIANLNIPASGRLLGHVRYVGHQYETS